MFSLEVKNGLKILNLAFLYWKVSIIMALHEKPFLKCADQSKSSIWGNLADRPCTNTTMIFMYFYRGLANMCCVHTAHVCKSPYITLFLGINQRLIQLQ